MGEKPDSMQLKDWLIRKTSHGLSIDEPLVEAVISHQFKSMLEAMKSNDTVEVSGFGKFIFNNRMCQRKIAKIDNILKSCHQQLIDEADNPKRVERIKRVMSETMSKKKILMDRIHGKAESDLRRVEEQPLP